MNRIAEFVIRNAEVIATIGILWIAIFVVFAYWN